MSVFGVNVWSRLGGSLVGVGRGAVTPSRPVGGGLPEAALCSDAVSATEGERRCESRWGPRMVVKAPWLLLGLARPLLSAGTTAAGRVRSLRLWHWRRGLPPVSAAELRSNVSLAGTMADHSATLGLPEGALWMCRLALLRAEGSAVAEDLEGNSMRFAELQMSGRATASWTEGQANGGSA